jgi:hypothetical protein
MTGNRWKFACPEHLIGPAADFCTPCRATWTSAAADWLRDLIDGDARDACGPKVPTTLAEAADELDALAAAIKTGDVS